jgi:type IV secretory pathway TraG/TraD family ATPase VirD4
MFSNFLGEEEVRYKQRSRGSSDGKGSMNISEQDKTRKLFEPSRFLKLKTGHCILINPGYSNAKEAAIPIQQAIKLPGTELRAIKQSQEVWKGLQQGLRKKSKGKPPSQEDLMARHAAADELFKEKPQRKNKQGAIDPNDIYEKMKKLNQS